MVPRLAAEWATQTPPSARRKTRPKEMGDLTATAAATAAPRTASTPKARANATASDRRTPATRPSPSPTARTSQSANRVRSRPAGGVSPRRRDGHRYPDITVTASAEVTYNATGLERVRGVAAPDPEYVKHKVKCLCLQAIWLSDTPLGRPSATCLRSAEHLVPAVRENVFRMEERSKRSGRSDETRCPTDGVTCGASLSGSFRPSSGFDDSRMLVTHDAVLYGIIRRTRSTVRNESRTVAQPHGSFGREFRGGGHSYLSSSSISVAAPITRSPNSSGSNRWADPETLNPPRTSPSGDTTGVPTPRIPPQLSSSLRA